VDSAPNPGFNPTKKFRSKLQHEHMFVYSIFMFSSARGQLNRIETSGMTRRHLVNLVEELRRLKGATAALEARATAAIDALRDDGLDGAGVLRVVGRMSSRSAARTASTAEQLADMSRASAALESGKITSSHAASIASAAQLVSTGEADAALSDRAANCPADTFAKECREWAARHRHDSAEELHIRQRSARSVSEWTDSEGMFNLRARLHPEAGAILKSRLDHRTDQMYNDDGGRDGSPDTVRTTIQRRADALLSLIGSGSNTDVEPASDVGSTDPGSNSGRRATFSLTRHPKHQITVVSDISRLRCDNPNGVAEIIGSPGPVPQSMLERMACDATITGVLFDGPGRPIRVGRSVRSATSAQWTALIARDKGCVGCGAHVNRCEAHHIKAWQANGRTDINNLVLLCSRCHHDVHDRGTELVRIAGRWQIRLRSAGHPPGPPKSQSLRPPPPKLEIDQPAARDLQLAIP